VQSVQAAVAARPRAAALAALPALALALCSPLLFHGHARTAQREAAQAAAPATALIGGLPLQQARCEQWLGGSAAERWAVLGALKGVVGGPSTSGGVGTTLTRPQAYALFDRACASPIARGFLLYELYIRAAGFRSYIPPSGV
jgi:hypothetical protein